MSASSARIPEITPHSCRETRFVWFSHAALGLRLRRYSASNSSGVLSSSSEWSRSSLNHDTHATGGGFEVVEPLPGPAVGRQGSRVPVQLGLEDAHDRLGHGVVDSFNRLIGIGVITSRILSERSVAVPAPVGGDERVGCRVPVDFDVE